MLEGRLENAWRNREIEHSVALLFRNVSLDPVQTPSYRLIGRAIGKVAIGILNPRGQPLPRVLIYLAELIGGVEGLAHRLRKRVRIHRVAANTDEHKAFRQ